AAGAGAGPVRLPRGPHLARVHGDGRRAGLVEHRLRGVGGEAARGPGGHPEAPRAGAGGPLPVAADAARGGGRRLPPGQPPARARRAGRLLAGGDAGHGRLAPPGGGAGRAVHPLRDADRRTGVAPPGAGARGPPGLPVARDPGPALAVLVGGGAARSPEGRRAGRGLPPLRRPAHHPVRAAGAAGGVPGEAPAYWAGLNDFDRAMAASMSESTLARNSGVYSLVIVPWKFFGMFALPGTTSWMYAVAPSFVYASASPYL